HRFSRCNCLGIWALSLGIWWIGLLRCTLIFFLLMDGAAYAASILSAECSCMN
ncbi:hypothetical protein Dimus_024029, partial [Dionaea muscipula]